MGTMHPAKPIHPGRLLKRELDVRDISVSALAAQLGVSVKELERIVDKKGAVTPDLAEALERAWGTSAQTWLNVQARFEAHPRHGGKRKGAGRKRTGKANKQVRFSAPEKEMAVIVSWLNQQPNQAQAIADALYKAASGRG